MKQIMSENQEAEELIEDILKIYGYDFQGYSRASLYRRIKRFVTNKEIDGIKSLKEKVGKSPEYFEHFLQEVTVNVTEMFRDPTFFKTLKETVFPILSTYPYIKIWDAGCSTGEELYSLAIFLKEADLLHKSRIYATDVNQKVLQKAKEGIYPVSFMREYIQNYHMAGGRQDFSEYYTANYGYAKLDQTLVQNVIFYPHNLATDGSFNEFHLIICRNVLIYFTRNLQEKVYQLFADSLSGLGYLCLGKKENLSLSWVETQFKIISKEEKIYRRIS